MRASGSAWLLRASFLALVLTVQGEPAAAGTAGDDGAPGAFTCDFAIDLQVLLDNAAGLIERDRILMSAAGIGMQHKHIPIRPDLIPTHFLGGGRYLFDTVAHAEAYRKFVVEDFEIGGVQFFDRPGFGAPDCHAWEAIAAQDFADIHGRQTLVRTERWSVPAGDWKPFLTERWPSVTQAAESAGRTAVWLLYNRGEKLVSLVYFDERLVPPNPVVPDVLGLLELEVAAPLGAVFDDQPWERTYDKTHFVLTIWFPYVAGDHGEPALWPNSPPLPEPSCGDAVCEPSRGEDHASCPGECAPRCGDTLCQADEGEDVYACPSDCQG